MSQVEQGQAANMAGVETKQFQWAISHNKDDEGGIVETILTVIPYEQVDVARQDQPGILGVAQRETLQQIRVALCQIVVHMDRETGRQMAAALEERPFVPVPPKPRLVRP